MEQILSILSDADDGKKQTNELNPIKNKSETGLQEQLWLKSTQNHKKCRFWLFLNQEFK